MSKSKVILSIVLASALVASAASAAVPGRLTVDTTNPRWVTNNAGKAIVLTGQHHWHINQKYKNEALFPWQWYQDTLVNKKHNFYRGWTWTDTNFSPFIYAGGPPFDLDSMSTGFTNALASRLNRANQKGLYTSVMLFQGWSIQDGGPPNRPLRVDNPWSKHPFNVNNNRDMINGDFTSAYQGSEIHADLAGGMSNAITAKQQKYARFVVDRLRGYTNLIWEISNESPAGGSYRNWQNLMVSTIKGRDNSHLILVSCRGAETRSSMMNTTAQMVAVCQENGAGITSNPDPLHADGTRVLIADSDHIQPRYVTDRTWAWKFFLRGYHPWFMDLTQPKPTWWRDGWNTNAYKDVPRSLGAIQKVAATTNLRMLVPQAKGAVAPVKYKGYSGKIFALYSTNNPRQKSGNWADGKEYLALGEPGRILRLCNLQVSPTTVYNYEWRNALTGTRLASGSVTNKAGSCKNFTNTTGKWAVLHAWL